MEVGERSLQRWKNIKCVCVCEGVRVQGVPVPNVRLEQGGDTHAWQVNKRHIEQWKGKGKLSISFAY